MPVKEEKQEQAKSAETVVELPLNLLQFYKLGFTMQRQEGSSILTRNGSQLTELPASPKEEQILTAAQGWLEHLIFGLTAEQWSNDWQPYLKKLKVLK